MCFGSVAVTVESVWPFFWRVWIYPLAGNTSEPSIICLASRAGQDFPSKTVFCKKMLTPWDLLLVVVVGDLSKLLTETRQARVMLVTCRLVNGRPAIKLGLSWKGTGQQNARSIAACQLRQARPGHPSGCCVPVPGNCNIGVFLPPAA